ESPDDARVARWVVPNIELCSLETRPGGLGPGKIPDIPIWAMRDYGNRVGVFRLMEVLDRYGVRATVALNSDICVHHPEIIEEGEASLGMDGTQPEQLPPPQRSAGRRGAHDHPRHARYHRESERHASRRLAWRGPAGDLEHARSLGGGRLRICRRLGPQRRSALRDDARRGQDDHGVAVQL